MSTTIVANFPIVNIINYTSNGSTTTNSTTTTGNCVCPSTVLFLQALTNKLVDMTTSLKNQFTKLKDAAIPTSTTRGTILASTTVRGNVSFKQEFGIYLQRFGPPSDGVFDPLFLELIRAELKAGIII
jgi:hypothetical protein